MESLSLEKENLNKDMRHLFRLKKEINYTSIKDIINLFSLENDKAIEELFESLKIRSQNNLEELMKISEFVFDYVHLMYYKCHI